MGAFPGGKELRREVIRGRNLRKQALLQVQTILTFTKKPFQGRSPTPGFSPGIYDTQSVRTSRLGGACASNTNVAFNTENASKGWCLVCVRKLPLGREACRLFVLVLVHDTPRTPRTRTHRSYICSCYKQEQSSEANICPSHTPTEPHHTFSLLSMGFPPP